MSSLTYLAEGEDGLLSISIFMRKCFAIRHLQSCYPYQYSCRKVCDLPSSIMLSISVFMQNGLWFAIFNHVIYIRIHAQCFVICHLQSCYPCQCSCRKFLWFTIFDHVIHVRTNAKRFCDSPSSAMLSISVFMQKRFCYSSSLITTFLEKYLSIS